MTGGWRYQPGQPGDTSVFGWQMFALRSARLSGLRVPKNVLRGCKTYLDSAATDRKRTMYSYMPGEPETPVMTAEALLSRQYLGWRRDYPPLVKGAAHVAKHLETAPERNIYYWYYATQLLHNMQNDDWKRWNLRVREGPDHHAGDRRGLRPRELGPGTAPSPTAGPRPAAGSS